MKSPWAAPNPHWDQPLEGDKCGKSEGRFLPCILPVGHEGKCNGWPAVLPVPKQVEIERKEDPTLDARRSWQGYYDAGLPWTGEFEDAVNRGEVDVS